MTRLTLALIACLLATPAAADTPLARQDGITLAARTIATGFDQPVFLTSPPGDRRLFVVEQPGRIRILSGGQVQPQLFLDIAGKIAFGGEQGLLGLAFHPDFAANARFFVYFTAPDGALTVAEGRASQPAALTPLLSVRHDQASNHNGGWLGFGPDGFLYIGTGDGGRGGDPWGNAQNPDVLLGKILRLDVDSATPYAIPPTNPFATGGGAPEVFALGLRNPWRAAFDGDRLYIGDVGQNEIEEINLITPADAGANLGWNRMEGRACFKSRNCATTGLTLPIFTYDHSLGCSVTGGYVYRGQAMPALQGRYFFSDFCAGTLMSFRLSDGQILNPITDPITDPITVPDGLASLGQVASFGQDGEGELYILTLDGTVSKLVPAP